MDKFNVSMILSTDFFKAVNFLSFKVLFLLADFVKQVISLIEISIYMFIILMYFYCMEENLFFNFN